MLGVFFLNNILPLSENFPGGPQTQTSGSLYYKLI